LELITQRDAVSSLPEPAQAEIYDAARTFPT